VNWIGALAVTAVLVAPVLAFLVAVIRAAERVEVKEVCVEEGCYRPATHERPEGFIGSDLVVELVCRRHGGMSRVLR